MSPDGVRKVIPVMSDREKTAMLVRLFVFYRNPSCALGRSSCGSDLRFAPTRWWCAESAAILSPLSWGFSGLLRYGGFTSLRRFTSRASNRDFRSIVA